MNKSARNLFVIQSKLKILWKLPEFCILQLKTHFTFKT